MNKGEIYTHYKTKRRYKIAAIAQRESDLEPLAVYIDVTDPTCRNCKPLWVRPVLEFSDEVTDPITNETTTRFELCV